MIMMMLNCVQSIKNPIVVEVVVQGGLHFPPAARTTTAGRPLKTSCFLSRISPPTTRRLPPCCNKRVHRCARFLSVWDPQIQISLSVSAYAALVVAPSNGHDDTINSSNYVSPFLYHPLPVHPLDRIWLEYSSSQCVECHTNSIETALGSSAWK